MINHSQVNHSDLIKLYRQALKDGIEIDQIDQKIDQLAQRTNTSEKVEAKTDEQKYQNLKKSLPLPVRIGAMLVPVFLLMLGFVLVGSAVLPILFSLFKNNLETQMTLLLAPIPQEEVLDITPLIIAQANDQDEAVLGEVIEEVDQGPIILDSKLDYSNLSNWFENSTLPSFSLDQFEGQADEYIIEIPELKIENALVKVGGTDLNKSLIHYPGTALPGKQGTPVIFGHSVLRQFYHPKESNPRRYNSIFSTIMTLKKGDKIYIKYGNIKYTYVVQSLTEVKPTDTYILSQRYDVRQLKLVTCVPEGTYLRRGVVTASLIKE